MRSAKNACRGLVRGPGGRVGVAVAVRDGLNLRAEGTKVDLGATCFALGFAQKNLGKIDDAITSMHASLAERPGSTATQLALAGYLAIGGQQAEAKEMFASIPVPPADQLAHMDYHTNSAWFAGVSRDKPGVLDSVKATLDAAKRFNYAGLLQYFKTEPDLDWLRGDKDFEALLARYDV